MATLPKETLDKIVELHLSDANLSMKDISKELNISYSTTCKYIGYYYSDKMKSLSL